MAQTTLVQMQASEAVVSEPQELELRFLPLVGLQVVLQCADVLLPSANKPIHVQDPRLKRTC